MNDVAPMVARDDQAAERERLRAALGDEQRRSASLAAERDALHEEISRCRETIRELQTRLVPPAPADQPLAISAQPRQRRGLSQRVALAAYRVVRPVARPVVWRMRSFLVGDLVQRIDAMALSLPPKIEELQRAVQESANKADPIAGASLEEMRRLAREMEQVLLTLALATPRDRFAERSLESEPAEETDRIG